jgi:O-antigen/teichoic acid export membrane protein
MAREAVPVLILGLIGALVLWFSAPLLVHLFFGPQYEGSIPLLRLLGFAAVPLLMLDLAQGVLIVLAKRRQLIVVASIGAAAVLLSLIALSATLGPFGAAVACIVGYSVAAAVAWGALILDTRKSSRTDARAEL